MGKKSKITDPFASFLLVDYPRIELSMPKSCRKKNLYAILVDIYDAKIFTYRLPA